MRKMFRYIWKHKVVRCADEYCEARVQGAISVALSLVSLLLPCGLRRWTPIPHDS
jgi:hypothetical protein